MERTLVKGRAPAMPSRLGPVMQRIKELAAQIAAEAASAKEEENKRFKETMAANEKKQARAREWSEHTKRITTLFTDKLKEFVDALKELHNHAAIREQRDAAAMGEVKI